MNKNKSTFTLVGENGIEVEYEMLFTFDSDDTKKSYMVYTDHEKDSDGREKVYASTYDPTGVDKDIKSIETQDEWNLIENILTSIQNKIKEENSSK